MGLWGYGAMGSMGSGEGGISLPRNEGKNHQDPVSQRPQQASDRLRIYFRNRDRRLCQRRVCLTSSRAAPYFGRLLKCSFSLCGGIKKSQSQSVGLIGALFKQLIHFPNWTSTGPKVCSIAQTPFENVITLGRGSPGLRERPRDPDNKQAFNNSAMTKNWPHLESTKKMHMF